jgi:hypothetical protein
MQKIIEIDVRAIKNRLIGKPLFPLDLPKEVHHKLIRRLFEQDNI